MKRTGWLPITCDGSVLASAVRLEGCTAAEKAGEAGSNPVSRKFIDRVPRLASTTLQVRPVLDPIWCVTTFS